MTIHPLYHDINVRIGSQGAYMREYPDEGQDKLRERLERVSVPDQVRRRTSSCYIESVTDAQFEIILDVGGDWMYGCQLLGFECLVDGKYIETPVCLPSAFVNGRWTHILSSQIVPTVVNGVSVPRRFTFSNVNLVDDRREEGVQVDTKRVLDVGSIVVKVRRMVNGPENTANNAVPIDADPMAVFVFRYRTREILNSLSNEPHPDDSTMPIQNPLQQCTTNPIRIIDHSSTTLPSPSIAANVDPLANFSPEQLVCLAREQLSIAKISTLAVGELERLAAPHADVLNLTLKELKEVASQQLMRTEEIMTYATNLPYRELKALASERLTTLGQSSIEARVMLPSNADSIPDAGGPSVPVPNLSSQINSIPNQNAVTVPVSPLLPAPFEEPLGENPINLQALRTLASCFPGRIPVGNICPFLGELGRLQALEECHSLIAKGDFEESLILGGCRSILQEAEKLANFNGLEGRSIIERMRVKERCRRKPKFNWRAKYNQSRAGIARAQALNARYQVDHSESGLIHLKKEPAPSETKPFPRKHRRFPRRKYPTAPPSSIPPILKSEPGTLKIERSSSRAPTVKSEHAKVKVKIERTTSRPPIIKSEPR